MGHTVTYYEYPETVDRKKIEADLSTYVEKECWQEGGHMSKIRWINDAPCANEDEAREKIGQLDKGWYDCLAVKFYDTHRVPETEKLKKLQAAKTTAYKKYNDLAFAFHFANAKSELIGCKCCGSKISRKYLKNNFCPVCHSDLRPETTLNRIATLKAKADKLYDEVLNETTKIAKKSGNIRWLIKIEYHQ